MFVRAIRVLAVVSLAAGALVAAPVAASAVDDPVNWTKITTPSKTFTYRVDSSQGAVNQLRVSGLAHGSDFSSVDIVCVIDSPSGGFNGRHLADAVPVTDGAFTVQADVPQALGICHLRAIPSNIPDYAYLGSFSGPIMYSYTFGQVVDGAKTVDFAVATGSGSGIAALTDASACPVAGLLTVDMPDVELRGPGTPMCAFGLHTANLTDTGTPTASAVRVDGKNAYLPGGVASYLRGTLGLALPQPGITTTFSRSSSTGNVTVTESERLWRCNGNAYVPTAESCTTLVDTGVTLKVVTELVRGNHQVLIFDSYVSRDGHAHTVTAQYQVQIARARDGAPGYIYPKHPGSFKKAAVDKVVTGFGTGPGTVLVRSDVFASSTDAQADTQALTWSRPPAEIQFSHDSTSVMALPYRFSVTASHAAKLGLAVSEAPLTADAKALAAKAVAAL